MLLAHRVQPEPSRRARRSIAPSSNAGSKRRRAMGFFGKLLGIEDDTQRQRSPRDAIARGPVAGAPDADAQALERYRYMLKTAPPETLEQAHAEAFAKLTPEQRRR